jgi:hypothetical protein
MRWGILPQVGGGRRGSRPIVDQRGDRRRNIDASDPNWRRNLALVSVRGGAKPLKIMEI